MRYNRMGRSGVYRMAIPKLSGGIHAGTDSTLIGNNELADACNVQWKNGGLRTRQALRAVGMQPMVAISVNQISDDSKAVQRTDCVCRHPFDVDGQLCTVVISGAKFGPINDRVLDVETHVQVVSLDGEVLQEYRLDTTITAPVAVAPCDKSRYGFPFLLYRNNEVYWPNRATHTMERLEDDRLYAPLVMINGKSVGGSSDVPTPPRCVQGVMYEGYNRLTPRYRARFSCGNGTATEWFFLPTLLASGADVLFECVTCDRQITLLVPSGGTATFNIGAQSYTVQAHPGKGAVSVMPALPKTDVADTVTVTVSNAAPTAGTTNGATLATWFGGTQDRLGGTRLFLSGFEDEAAKVIWSDVNNPLYFPENNYMLVGDVSQRVTALDKQENMLLIFKERELYYTTYVQGSIDEETVLEGTNVDVTVTQAYFPLTQLSAHIGCDCPHSIAACRDRLVWMCSDARVYTLVATTRYSELNVCQIGRHIQPYLLSHDSEQRKQACAGDYDGCYVLFVGNCAYSFDYNNGGFSSLSSYSSEESIAKAVAWFRHEYAALPKSAAQQIVTDGAYRAVVISTQDIETQGLVKYAVARMLYRFDNSPRDYIAALTLTGAASDLSGAVTTTIVEFPIRSCLITKTFDFSDISCFKRIKAVYLTANAQELTVQCIADRHNSTARHRFCSEHMQTHLLLPAVKRCQVMALHVESDRPVCVQGLRVHYVPFGRVT